MRVIFLHHAGGDKYSWRRYREALSPEIRQLSLEIPGRGDRYREPLLQDMSAIVEDLFIQMRSYVHEPYILVGKSMGALKAYLLLHKLVENGLPLPLHVFLGSRKCPASYADHIRIAQEPAPVFWKGIEAYGGCPPALLQHEELKELYEPILRADFTALERYIHQQRPKLPVAATVMVGKEDRIALDTVRGWQHHFSGEVDFMELNGGHFFMHEQAFTISKMIEDKFAGHLIMHAE